MMVIYDLFDVPMPLVAPYEKHSSKRKRTFLGAMEINPKRKRSSQFKKGDVVKWLQPPTE